MPARQANVRTRPIMAGVCQQVRAARGKPKVTGQNQRNWHGGGYGQAGYGAAGYAPRRGKQAVGEGGGGVRGNQPLRPRRTMSVRRSCAKVTVKGVYCTVVMFGAVTSGKVKAASGRRR